MGRDDDDDYPTHFSYDFPRAYNLPREFLLKKTLFCHLQEKKPEQAKKSKKDENGADDDDDVDDEDAEAEDEEYDMPYGEFCKLGST